jgi:hypothetical protein
MSEILDLKALEQIKINEYTISMEILGYHKVIRYHNNGTKAFELIYANRDSKILVVLSKQIDSTKDYNKYQCVDTSTFELIEVHFKVV